MTQNKKCQHECSCGDTQINHAHEFPELGCVCLTCGENSPPFEGSELVMYDEECVHNLKKMIPLINSMKTSFDHVRGDVEAREIMVATINKAIEIIELK
tara:strand:- start:15560 stop:15856 length:297 start_codon:yes stop_codon:yes gene_type:complete